MIEEIGQGEFKGFPQNLIFGGFFKQYFLGFFLKLSSVSYKLNTNGCLWYPL